MCVRMRMCEREKERERSIFLPSLSLSPLPAAWVYQPLVGRRWRQRCYGSVPPCLVPLPGLEHHTWQLSRLCSHRLPSGGMKRGKERERERERGREEREREREGGGGGVVGGR